MKIGKIFDEFNVKMNPKSKPIIAILILSLSLVFVGNYASASSYEYGEETHWIQVGYQTSTRNGTLLEPFVLRPLFTYGRSDGVVWNLTVTENVSVFLSTDWKLDYTFNGTGGFYEGNHTCIKIALLLNGTEGSYEYNLRFPDWRIETVQTATFVPWRFWTNLAYIVVGGLLVSSTILYVNNASLRKNGGNGPDQ
jgi:hypothetical protein